MQNNRLQKLKKQARRSQMTAPRLYVYATYSLMIFFQP